MFSIRIYCATGIEPNFPVLVGVDESGVVRNPLLVWNYPQRFAILHNLNHPKCSAGKARLKMPVMDGPVTIRALRKLNPQVRIIASSGLTESIDAADIDQLGVKTFLIKPYDAKTLLKAVAKALSQDTFIA